MAATQPLDSTEISMTVTCSHCGEIFAEIPIISDPDAGLKDLLGRMLSHLMTKHSKPAHNSPQMLKARKGQPCQCKGCAHDRIVQEAGQKTGLISAALIGQVVFGEFTSTDEEYNKKKAQSFQDVLKLVMEFEPKGAPAVQ